MTPIIVLGGGVLADGSLKEDSKARIVGAIKRYKEGDYLLLSGKHGFLESPPKVTEARSMANYAIAKGIPEKSIIIEEASTDTIGNAIYTKPICESKNFKDIIVITSDYHVERSKYIFEKVYGRIVQVVGVPSKDLERRSKIEGKTLLLTQDWLDHIEDGDVNSIKQILELKHPAYSKNPEYSVEDLLAKITKDD